MKSPATYKGVAIGITIAVHALFLLCLYFPQINASLLPSDESNSEVLPIEEIEQMIFDLDLVAMQSEQPTDSRGEGNGSTSSQASSQRSTVSANGSNASESSATSVLGNDSLGSVFAEKIERTQPLLAQRVEPDVVLEKGAQVVLDSTMIALVEQIRQQDKVRYNNGQSRNDRLTFYRENYRSIYNFLKVYSYALTIRDIMADLDSQLLQVENDRERRILIKQTEKELFERFEKVVRKMSYSQGKVLLKLIARETGQSTYDIIKNYKGSLTAGFWYNVGKLFTANLKVEYDKEGEDKVLEEILQRSEKGEYLLVEKGVYLY